MAPISYGSTYSAPIATSTTLAAPMLTSSVGLGAYGGGYPLQLRRADLLRGKLRDDLPGDNVRCDLRSDYLCWVYHDPLHPRPSHVHWSVESRQQVLASSRPTPQTPPRNPFCL